MIDEATQRDITADAAKGSMEGSTVDYSDDENVAYFDGMVKEFKQLPKGAVMWEPSSGAEAPNAAEIEAMRQRLAAGEANTKPRYIHAKLPKKVSEMTTPFDDLDALRRESELGQTPEWVAKYGDESWNAALAVMGFSPCEPTGGTGEQ
jgi:hypothetical protein